MRSSLKHGAVFSIFSALFVAVVASLAGLRRTLEAKGRPHLDVEELLNRLERDRAVLRSIIEHVPIGLLFASPDGVVQLDNDALRQLISTIPGSARIASVHEVTQQPLYWEDGHRVTPEEWGRLMREATERRVDVMLQSRGPAGPAAWTWSCYAPVRAETDGRLLGLVGVVRDVSAEHTIRELREELVAVIAHDLRSPIASIELSLENALRHPAPPPGEEVAAVPLTALRRMTRSAQRLGEMVGDLLDASRVELGKLSLDLAATDLTSFLAQLVSDVSPSLRDHPVHTDLPQHPVVAPVDPLRLTQVVTNLLDNAAKYSRAGSTIHLTLCEEGRAVHLSVADEGPGIAPADLPMLFDRFFQARRARKQKGGLGLGLYISKGIVDAHGGKLSVESELGVGSTFHVWLRMPSAT